MKADGFDITYLVGAGALVTAELIAVATRRGQGDTITEKLRAKPYLHVPMVGLLTWATYHFVVETSPALVVDLLFVAGGLVAGAWAALKK